MTRRRQFGSIRKLPSGRYQARYIGPAGERITAPELFATKSDAGTYLDREHTKIVDGNWIDPRLGRVRFDEWVQQYLDGAVHLRETTKTQKRRVLQRRWVPAFGRRPLSSITRIDVRNQVAAMTAELAPQTVHTEYAVLSALFEAAVDAEILLKSPCRKIPLPEIEKDEKPRVSPEDLQRLADAIDERYAALVWTTGLLGLRWEEVAALRVKSIDFLARPAQLRVIESVHGPYLKNDPSRRTIPMPPFLVDELARHLATGGRADPEALAFPAPRGGMLRYNDFRSRKWNPASVAAGLGRWTTDDEPKPGRAWDRPYEGLTIHGLRHSAAGNWRAAGLHTQLIARWLGHSSDRTTSQTYGWVPDALDVEGVAAVQAMLEKSLGHAEGTSTSRATSKVRKPKRGTAS